MKFTRTLTTFEATAFTVDLDDNLTPTVNTIASVKFMATRAGTTEARKAFAENGYTIKRGSRIKIVPVEEVVYACDLDDFMKIATPISSNKVDASDDVETDSKPKAKK